MNIYNVHFTSDLGLVSWHRREVTFYRLLVVANGTSGRARWVSRTRYIDFSSIFNCTRHLGYKQVVRVLCATNKHVFVREHVCFLEEWLTHSFFPPCTWDLVFLVTHLPILNCNWAPIFPRCKLNGLKLNHEPWARRAGKQAQTKHPSHITFLAILRSTINIAFFHFKQINNFVWCAAQFAYLKMWESWEEHPRNMRGT